jgi:hypothetical protein
MIERIYAIDSRRPGLVNIHATSVTECHRGQEAARQTPANMLQAAGEVAIQQHIDFIPAILLAGRGGRPCRTHGRGADY